MKKIVLFGAPGSGKGTLASQLLKVEPNLVHISTGDIFRENLKNETPLGLKAKSYMDKGELVPDSVVNDMINERLNREDIKINGFILDGYPRTMAQANALEEMTDLDMCLLLEVPRDVITKRILGRYSCDKCGAIYNKFTLLPKKEGICDICGAEIHFKQRTDDNEETLKKRLDVYEENAKPIIEFYAEKSLLRRVNAENTLELTENDIKEIIA